MAAISRRLRFFERQWPWLVFTVLAALATAGAALVLDFGLLAEYELFPSILRGYTATGVLLGLSSVALSAIAFFYALRKRVLQERLPLGRATMAAWLWAHVYFGILALITAFAHAGYGLFSAELTSGKLLLLFLFAIVVTGLLWRFVYGVVPASAAREVGNYSQRATGGRAEADLIEIEKLAAGKSPRFQELKHWLMSLPRDPTPIELTQAAASLPAPEQAALPEVAALASSRREALTRQKKQARYAQLLQGWRVFHVPLSLLVIALLPVHVIMAYDMPARVVPAGTLSGAALGGFEKTEACATCHASIVQEFKNSMHAHAMTSPLMIAQTNQALRHALGRASSPDPREICVNCHGPIGAALTEQADLPLRAESALGDDSLINEGISCAVCHQWSGQGHPGQGGFVAFQKGLEPGRTYYGPIGDPVGNAFHRSEKSELWNKPEELCQNCHSVKYDKNGDGKYERGNDLVLQTLFDEWRDYQKAGGVGTCISCHMPIRAGERAADTAEIPFEQDQDAPKRRLHDHTFVAVDYPLDNLAVRDATRARRQALLASAASLRAVPGTLRLGADDLSFELEVANIGSGHNLPGGFAFVRQMWLEVTIQDDSGRILASSGALSDASRDLCDASIVSDPESPMRPFVEGCSEPDSQLVNFQQMLLDRVQVRRDRTGAPLLDKRGEFQTERAPDAKEAIIQHVDGGPIPRTRPSTKKPTPPLLAGEAATFPYRFALNTERAHTLKARLLFRNVPPYFLRALSIEQAPTETKIAPLVSALEVIEMASIAVRLR